jgi:ribosomal-protein-alanine N-acetyltransferase
MKASIRRIEAADADAFVAAVQASRRLHRPWIHAPADADAFRAYLARMSPPQHFGFLVCAGGQPAGVINLSNIVYGALCSGYLGYYAFAGFEGRGLMAQGLRAVVRHAFDELGLHRVEANIQPGNAASIALARACGFQLEGYSPRYLKIGGRWRDHERWARVKA